MVDVQFLESPSYHVFLAGVCPGDVNLECDGKPPLVWASERGHVDNVKMLLADPHLDVGAVYNKWSNGFELVDRAPEVSLEVRVAGHESVVAISRLLGIP